MKSKAKVVVVGGGVVGVSALYHLAKKGPLKDCWLTTMVSAPMPLGSSV